MPLRIDHTTVGSDSPLSLLRREQEERSRKAAEGERARDRAAISQAGKARADEAAETELGSIAEAEALVARLITRNAELVQAHGKPDAERTRALLSDDA